VLRRFSPLCEACREAIAEAEADDAAKLEAAKLLLAKHHAKRRSAQDWKGNPQPPSIVRVHQLADAFREVGKADHYMVGIVYDFRIEELEAAEQVLIDWQNAGPQKGKAFQALERALDQIDSARTKLRQSICGGAAEGGAK
jgi:anti-sigma factor RsiW